MSADDELLLLRRFRLRGGVSTNGPHDLQPVPSPGSTAKLPQPPQLNRQVQSVYDARPSFTREFWLEQADELVPTGGALGNWVYHDFSFSVPDGYLGVLRRLQIQVSGQGGVSDGEAVFLLLMNGAIVMDVKALPGADPTRPPGILLVRSDGVFEGANFELQDVYLEIPPGGTFAVRIFNDFIGTEFVPIMVSARGQFLRAANVPVELQIASPPQVTPVVPAAGSVWSRPKSP